MRALESARALANQGIEGDRYFSKIGAWSGTPGAVRDSHIDRERSSGRDE